jgi:hypothetical protein
MVHPNQNEIPLGVKSKKNNLLLKSLKSLKSLKNQK